MGLAQGDYSHHTTFAPQGRITQKFEPRSSIAEEPLPFPFQVGSGSDSL